MHFFPLKNKTKLVPVKFGVLLGFGLLDTYRARGSLTPRRGLRCASGCTPCLRAPAAAPPAAGRPTPLPDARREARAWLAVPTRPGPLSERPRRRGRPARGRGLRDGPCRGPRALSRWGRRPCPGRPSLGRPRRSRASYGLRFAPGTG